MNAASICFNSVSWVTISCCHDGCGCLFAIPDGLYNVLRRDASHWFYCPHGHKQHYSESEADKLRKELEIVRGNVEFHKNNAAAERRARELTATKLKSMKSHFSRAKHERDTIRTRVQNGVCPCCNRSFTNLRRHMATKHPKVGLLKRRRAA